MKLAMMNHHILLEGEFRTDGEQVWQLRRLFKSSMDVDYYEPRSVKFGGDDLLPEDERIIQWLLDTNDIYSQLIENSIDGTLYCAKEYDISIYTTHLAGWVYMRPQDYTFWKLSQPR